MNPVKQSYFMLGLTLILDRTRVFNAVTVATNMSGASPMACKKRQVENLQLRYPVSPDAGPVC
jgi:hypothetical protein